MPVVAISAVINGFIPIRYQTANRNLLLGRLTLIEVLSQFLSILVLVTLAFCTRSVWSLVLGGLVGSAAKLFLVSQFMDGRRSSFSWHRGSLRDIVHFGKWIFLGSVVGFFANQGDKLILASYMTKAELGVYSIAFGISSIVWALHSKINHLIFFPIYSNLRDLSPAELRPRVYKARIVMCLCLLPPLILLILFGVEVIGFLYDERYEKAGWMIQIISTGYIISVGTNIGPFYLAQGNSKLMTILIAVKAAIFIICMLIGAEFFGVVGVLVGGAVSHLVFYFIETSVYRYYKLWIWKLDFIFLSIILCVVSYSFGGIVNSGNYL
jgi:O-antigen/teichoic acid export membrane protein